MSRISDNGQEQASSPIGEAVAANPAAFMHAGYPMMLCGVNRKINTGNFENIDVYCAISVPIMLIPEMDEEAFQVAVERAAEIGFGLASRETGQRYQLVKDMQRGGRQQPPPE